MGSFFITDPQYIGIDMHSSSLRVASLRKKNKKWEVVSLKELPLEEDVNPIDSQIGEGVIISSINSRDVLVRTCEIPLKKPKDVFSALDFHVEPLLPYSTDNAIIQGEITEKKEGSTTLTVFSTRKDHLTHHLETLKTLQIEPEVVTNTAHALAAFSTILPKTLSPILLVHEGDDEISIVLVEKGHVLAARSIDRKRNLETEIQKTLLSFSSTFKSKAFEAIYFIGKDKELLSSLQSSSEKEIQLPSSPSLSVTQEELTQFSLAIGNALTETSVNFRQKEFVYPHQFKRIKKPLLAFFTLSALLIGTVFGFGEVANNQKKQAIEHAYFSFLQVEDSMPSTLPETPLEYLASLNALEKKVRARPDTFPLLPQVPKAKEVLSWLTSLPEIQGKEGPLVDIESIHYQLVKRPDFTHKTTHYKVRIELELTANNSHTARAFQDTLKNNNPIVDSKEEVQWVSSRGKYKATFYLKDKTRYS